MATTIRLTAEQESWLKARVDDGEFSSVEAAALQCLDDRIAEEADDLLWAKPLLDEAYADIARGDVLSLAEHDERNKLRIADLKR